MIEFILAVLAVFFFVIVPVGIFREEAKFNNYKEHCDTTGGTLMQTKEYTEDWQRGYKCQWEVAPTKEEK